MITNSVINVYAIKDNVAGQFYPPELAETDGIEIRNVSLSVNGEFRSMIKMRPQDFSLYKIGSYDVKTGLIAPCEIEFLVNLIDLKEDLEHGKVKEN